MLSRRQFIAGSAVTLGAVALGGAGWRAQVGGVFSADDEPAFHPWREWDAASGLHRVALAGTLAASSHNTQPWRLAVRADAIDVAGDLDRTMGRADARGRELHISLGCAVENMTIAAASIGKRTTFALDRSQAPHAATLTFADAPAPLPGADLAKRIPLRRTNRGAYDPKRPIPAADLEALAAAAGPGLRVVWLTSTRDRQAFTDLSVEATAAHVADAGIQRDSHRWYRMEESAVERLRDGITIGGANLPLLATTYLRMFPPTPEAFDAQWATATRDTHCGTAPAFGLIVAPAAGDHAAWLETGRTWQRVQLLAGARGIAAHPISQSLTVRDADIADGGDGGGWRSRLSALAGTGDVTLAFRLGYPLREADSAPRRSLAQATA